MGDLNMVIRSVEEELGQKAPSGSKAAAEKGTQQLGGLGGGSGSAGDAAGGGGGGKELAVPGGAANVAAAAFAEVGGKKRRVRWSMHEQFEEDLKADLAEATGGAPPAEVDANFILGGDPLNSDCRRALDGAGNG